MYLRLERACHVLVPGSKRCEFDPPGSADLHPIAYIRASPVEARALFSFSGPKQGIAAIRGTIPDYAVVSSKRAVFKWSDQVSKSPMKNNSKGRIRNADVTAEWYTNFPCGLTNSAIAFHDRATPSGPAHMGDHRCT